MTEKNFEPGINETSFESKKQEYFTKLGLHVREAFKLHKVAGLWDKNKEGKRDWGNVSEHCLVEAARARVFSRLLGLGAENAEALVSAAALHDFFKKGQKEVIVAGGLSRASFAKASEEADKIMRSAGIDEKLIRLVNSVGDESLLKVQKVLALEKLSDEDIAFLVMHYVDDYTINAEWAVPNSFDRRMDAAEANPRYKRNNEEGRAVFGGKTAYEVQREVGHLVAKRLAELIKERSGKAVDPATLPEYVDEEIKREIEGKE